MEKSLSTLIPEGTIKFGDQKSQSYE